ncbi:MAG: FAD-dependent oxidoreductase [Pseudomonadota bacterium]|nr:FAD-dependent oxidoreductase [Pseudomonadota bacterium]
MTQGNPVTEPYKPEDIAVMGGGLAGCLTALFAARQKDALGRPQYRVTLYEARKSLFDGSSLSAARLHLGGEYPLDPPTGKDCLTGALIWKLLMPRNIYTRCKPMKFLVAQETQSLGERIASRQPIALANGTWMKADPDDHAWISIDGKNWHKASRKGHWVTADGITLFTDDEGKFKYLTVEKYLHFYDGIRQQYQLQFDRIRAARGWSETAAAEALFGMPEEGSFYKPLSRAELEAREFKNVAGGFQSQEPGLDIALYLPMIEHLLLEEEKKGNLSILTGCKVRKKGIRSLAGGHFEIRFDNGEVSPPFSQVVQSAGDGGAAITKPEKGEKIMAYRRGMGIFVASALAERHREPFFVMLADHGCMFCPGLGQYDAFCYAPGAEASHIDEKALSSRSRDIPMKWTRSISKEEEKRRLSKIADRLHHVAPFLHPIKPVGMIVRHTLNFQDSLEQRRHETTKEKIRRKIIMYPTKITLAPQAAIEAVEMLRARSAGRKPGRIDPLEIALRDNAYSLADLPIPDKATLSANFVHAHDDLDPLMNYVNDNDHKRANGGRGR